MITPQTIEEIKGRIKIDEVVGEFVKLKRRGANLMGNCPFHHEKTPSFTVSPAKELYKCFGCGKSGNAITFVMEHEKLAYPDALRWLANFYKIEIQETQISDAQKQQIATTDSLFIINSFAQKFFSDRLHNHPDGQAIALSYLHQRGFNDATISKFQLGYNPTLRNELANQLIANQFNKDLLPRTGLVVLRNENEWVDNYRGRIIFPIHNHSGKIIGFGARVIGKADKAPKYINTPENELYVKSKVLYGSYFARQAIDKADECLLVEGYTDVISLSQAGVENVVASGGTSLTTDQLRLIKKYTNHLTIIYDGDSAGVKAALRGLDMALEEGLDVKLVLIPDNEDPDSYVNKVGADAFRTFINRNKKDFILFKLEILLKETGNDIGKKNELVNQIAESLSRINKAEDFTKQQAYIKQCAALLKIDEGGLITLVNKYKRDKLTKEEKKSNQHLSNTFVSDGPPPMATPEDFGEPVEHSDTEGLLTSQDDKYEKNILRILLEYGINPWSEQLTIAEFVFAELEGFHFDNPQLEQLLVIYKQAYQAGEQPTTKTFLYHEDNAIRQLVINITLFPYELSQRWNTLEEGKTNVIKDTSIEDVSQSINYYKLRKLKKMLDDNQKEMENAPMEEQLTLIRIHKELKDMERALTAVFGTVILK